MANIEKVAKRQGLSIQTIFLAIYARVHMQQFAAETADGAGSQQRLIVGLYLANRSHSLEGLAESVIPTVNIIDTCVNFLRLPEQLAPGNEKLSLTAIQREELENLSATIPSDNQRIKSNGVTPPGAAEPDDLSVPTAPSILLPTIDVEAAVRKGRLDFGLFAPQCRLDGAIAETLIDAMRREMSALVTGFESM
ncbi:hypothetical protein LTR66_017572 [Elasticomyces elasticus]|nr:hypothetical protein LTR66_017572 [Elasticomyces elasticus]